MIAVCGKCAFSNTLSWNSITLRDGNPEFWCRTIFLIHGNIQMLYWCQYIHFQLCCNRKISTTHSNEMKMWWCAQPPKMKNTLNLFIYVWFGWWMIIIFGKEKPSWYCYSPSHKNVCLTGINTNIWAIHLLRLSKWVSYCCCWIGRFALNSFFFLSSWVFDSLINNINNLCVGGMWGIQINEDFLPYDEWLPVWIVGNQIWM